MKKSIIAILITSSFTAYSQTYDGTGSQLETAVFLGDSIQWMNLTSSDLGVIYRNNGNTSATNADLIVNYTSGTTPKFVIGGFNDQDDGNAITGNTVTLSQGNIEGSIYGGLFTSAKYTENVNISNNTSTLINDAANTNNNSNAKKVEINKNVVNISDNIIANGIIYGGNATLNYVSGDAIARSTTKIIVSFGKSYASTYANTYETVYYNKVSSSSNKISLGISSIANSSIYGGIAQILLTSGNATSGNSSGTATTSIQGYAHTNSSINSSVSTIVSNENTVFLNKKSSTKNSIYGGVAQLIVKTGYGLSGTSSITGKASKSNEEVTSKSSASTFIYSNRSNLAANNNYIYLSQESNISDSIYGGLSKLSTITGNASAANSSSTNITNNSDRTSSEATADSSISIAYSTVIANDNTIIIEQNTIISNSIYGGYSSVLVTPGTAKSGYATVNETTISSNAMANINSIDVNVEANLNTITIDGNIKNTSIYGGYVGFALTQGTATKADGSLGDNSVSLTGSRAVANNNIITLGEAATFSQTTGFLYGGYLHYNADFAPESYNVFSGNALNMNAKPLTVSQMGNFENYNFYINDTNKATINSKTALITVTDQLVHTGTITAKSSTANVATVQLKGVSGTNKIKTGDTLVLIDATQAKLIQESLINKDGSAGTATMQSMFTAPSNKVDVGLTRTADVNYIITDNDTEKTVKIYFDNVTVEKEKVQINIKPLAEGRLATLMNVTRGADTLNNLLLKHVDAGTFTPIAIIDGGINKYHSGSYIDARDYRMMVGSRYQILDNFYTGLTFEYGRSNYNSYNNFTSGRVHGQGHTYNYGASLFGKYSHYTDNNEFYIDASFRIGRTKTEFGTNDIITGAGTYAHYNSKAGYMGANIGSGYIYQLNDKYSFDTSLRYFYTRLSADSITIDGDNVNFKTAHSSRLQLKEQFNYQDTDFMTFYLAGIYEYEFSGKAGASSSGISIDAPSVQGSTGMIELGVITTPIENNKDFEIKFAARAASGKRDGVNASMMFKYDF